MDARPADSEWLFWVRLGLKVAVVAGTLYVAHHFYERHRIANTPLRPEHRKIELPDDAYTFVPKSYVTDLASARRKLVGKPLWIKEGYRWSYQPGDRLFGPLERVDVKAVAVRGGDVTLVFDRDGKEASFGIGSPERVFVDDIFFVKDPREIYSHWTEEMWQQAASGEAEVGMSEIQIGFALGVGEIARQSPGGATRIVDYKQCEAAGLQPVRVTYKRLVAASIDPL